MSATTAATHVLELARYTTRREDEAAFLAAHPSAIRAIKAAYPGLASVTVVRLVSTPETTTWVDVALWTSADDAHRAAAECMNLPEFAACARFMDQLVGVEHGEVVARY